MGNRFKLNNYSLNTLSISLFVHLFILEYHGMSVIVTVTHLCLKHPKLSDKLGDISLTKGYYRNFLKGKYKLGTNIWLSFKYLVKFYSILRNVIRFQTLTTAQQFSVIMNALPLLTTIPAINIHHTAATTGQDRFISLQSTA